VRYRLGDFDGPLDLLLHLVRSAQINIWNIPIAGITEQYLAVLDASEDLDLERTTDFYRMAATLLHIKSRMLLPVGSATGRTDDEEDPRAELVEQLIEYRRLRMLGDALADRFEPREWNIVPERRIHAAQEALDDDDEDAELDGSAAELLEVYRELRSGIAEALPFDLDDGVTVAEKVTLLHERLDRQARVRFDVLVRMGSAVELVCVLLAILEVVRAGRARVIQNSPFAEISLVAR
jgi:segregation and condensation protein A